MPTIIVADQGLQETWIDFAAKFKGKTPEEVADRLKNLVGETIDDDVVRSLGIETELPAAQIRGALDGFGTVLQVNQAMNVIRPPAAPVVTPAAPSASAVDHNADIGDAAPNQAQVQSFAVGLGLDPTAMFMFMNNPEMDISGMIPIPNVVAGYSPKTRNMFSIVMEKFQDRHGVPIVVINEDGSVNKPVTIEYIEGLEEGRDPATDNIYFDTDGIPHEVIKVGVDAQSVYDADPLDSTRVLQKNGMGIGNVNWRNVSLDVKQVVFYAVTRTNEIDPANAAHMTWLRDNIKPGTRRLSLHTQMPKAIGEFNAAFRAGTLPILRTMLSRSPRKQELFPRRRTAVPRDLSGVAENPDPSQPPRRTYSRVS